MLLHLLAPAVHEGAFQGMVAAAQTVTGFETLGSA
jgi:hypothetical protein